MKLDSLEYIIVLFDHSAPSFCYYEPPVTGTCETRQLSLPDFQKVVLFARDNGYKLTILPGKENLPEPYCELLAQAEYSVIKPLSKENSATDTIFTLDYQGDEGVFEALKPGGGINLILRMNSCYLADIPAIISKWSSRFTRLNIFISDLDTLPSGKLDEYNNILLATEELVYEHFLRGAGVELNFLTDRLLLDEMNNCNAGIRHITVAPNGKFYLCPAFYYENESEDIGSPETGIEIRNQHLLHQDNAPICNICDAFHCKRCVWLNRKKTLELNTPSKVQCTVAHLERNMSKKLSDRLRKNPLFRDFQPISAISYLDPFELISVNPELKRGWQRDEAGSDLSLEHLSERELLIKIYNIQLDILKQLKKG